MAQIIVYWSAASGTKRSTADSKDDRDQQFQKALWTFREGLLYFLRYLGRFLRSVAERWDEKGRRCESVAGPPL